MFNLERVTVLIKLKEHVINYFLEYHREGEQIKNGQ